MARQNTEPIEKAPTPTEIPAPLKDSLSPPPTQQFGVSLQFIKENNVHMVGSIPPVVRQCVEFLSQPDGKYERLENCRELYNAAQAQSKLRVIVESYL